MFSEPLSTSPRVALVGCCAKKLTHAAPARDLYVSPLFRASLAFAERACDRVLIVSALYGLVEPGTVLKPYDFRMQDHGGKAERESWGARTVGSAQLPGAPRPVYIVLAGQLYAEAIAYGCSWWELPRPETPLEGIKGVGMRIRWLRERVEMVGG